MRSMDQTQAPLRLLIVDDNANHSAGIKQLIELQSSHKIVGICTNGDEAVRRMANTEIDVVLMDISMPELDGIAAIGQILNRKPNAQVLVLTGYDEPDLIYRAMRAGSKGYLLKTMVTAQLMVALGEIANGKTYLPPILASKFFDEFHQRISQANRPDPTRQALLNYLTQREKEVLKLLTDGETYRNVADKLVISETTVKTHVNNIFQKLQVNDRTQAVLAAIKFGLVESSFEPMQKAV